MSPLGLAFLVVCEMVTVTGSTAVESRVCVIMPASVLSYPISYSYNIKFETKPFEKETLRERGNKHSVSCCIHALVNGEFREETQFMFSQDTGMTCSFGSLVFSAMNISAKALCSVVLWREIVKKRPTKCLHSEKTLKNANSGVPKVTFWGRWVPDHPGAPAEFSSLYVVWRWLYTFVWVHMQASGQPWVSFSFVFHLALEAGSPWAWSL